MAHRLAQGSDERFAAYVEELASVIGHADRVGPLEAYCIGLLLPSERKSVEPMRRSRHRSVFALSTNRCCISSAKEAGRTERCLGRCARWWCRRWNGTDGSRRGSLMTRAFPNRESTQSAWRGNIVVNWASRTIARLR